MLAIANVDKRYPNGLLALEGLDLKVAEGEILAIVGGSGCGKSTLLRLISGLDRATAGSVELDGSAIAAPRPEIGLVFQEPRLMPWLTIDQNVAFGIRHLPAAEQKTRVSEALARVGLASHAGHWPRELSGGMRMRVQLARALAVDAAVLLMDEPFAALDSQTRGHMQQLLQEIWTRHRKTVVFVTHDVREALVLGSRVVVMAARPGRVLEDLDVNLPRPRDPDEPALVELSRRIRDELRRAEEAGEPAAAQGAGEGSDARAAAERGVPAGPPARLGAPG